MGTLSSAFVIQRYGMRWKGISSKQLRSLFYPHMSYLGMNIVPNLRMHANGHTDIIEKQKTHGGWFYIPGGTIQSAKVTLGVTHCGVFLCFTVTHLLYSVLLYWNGGLQPFESIRTVAVHQRKKIETIHWLNFHAHDLHIGFEAVEYGYCFNWQQKVNLLSSAGVNSCTTMIYNYFNVIYPINSCSDSTRVNKVALCAWFMIAF